MLEDCFTGRNFAECGGTGGPLFACDISDTNADCRWFADGCVAEGYTVSTCPPDDLCCHDDFPFTDDQMSDEESYWPSKALLASGTRPWNRTDYMDVAVTVDPSLSAQPAALVCMGDIHFEAESGPCGVEWILVGLDDMLMIEFSSGGFSGAGMKIEVDVAAPGGVRARACLSWYTDVDRGRRCPVHDDVDCAVAGTLVVNQLDDDGGLAGTVDLSMASGARLSGTFRQL